MVAEYENGPIVGIEREIEMATRVTLSSVEKHLLHGGNLKSQIHPAWKEWRGKTITIGDPEPPSHNWKCKTKFVWPVITKKVLMAAGRKSAFVCCHQIKFPKKPAGASHAE